MRKFMVLRVVMERYEIEAENETEVAKIFMHDRMHDRDVRDKLVSVDPADVPLVIEPLYDDEPDKQGG